MYLMAFHMDGCKWPCRAEVLTCSAADASLFVDCRNHERIRIVRILADHPYRTVRAVACAVSAADFVSVHNAEVKVHDGVSYLDG